MEQQSTFWTKVLMFFSALLIITGIDFAIIMPIFFPDLMNVFYSLFTGSSTAVLSSTDQMYALWLLGISGAVMTGWGFMIFVLGYVLLKNNDAKIWIGIELGLLSWFVIDVFISVYTGALFNVVINIVFLVMFLIPIAGNYFSNIRNQTNYALS